MLKRTKFEDLPDLFNSGKLWQTEGLFSDHYLRTHLKDNDWWPKDDLVRPIYEFSRDLYNKRRIALAKNNEAFNRQELINKIIERLAFAWTDNLGIPDEASEPDYILFGSQAEKEAVIEKDKTTRYRAAIAILEAKKLQHPLSQFSKSQKRFPHQQIRDYLTDAQVLSWGILTNGNEWRLYCRDAKRQDFFALDFEEAIKSLDNFKVFVALFSPEAFQRDSQGKCRLDQVREAALSAQSKLEENLRERVFPILKTLANGFFSRSENKISDDKESLRLLYENCLIYLYRLLFILYAEGRNLLPVKSPSRKYYKNLSIERLKPSLRDFSKYDEQYLTNLCESIQHLFELINGDNIRMNQSFGIPRYNGGLFDPGNYELIEKWKISDVALAQVLRGLLFKQVPRHRQQEEPLETVDFGDLRVQHLGSIYEGLLEHHLVRADGGQLELETDRAERKATGTYYTPDYIVKYIIEQTLTPLIAEIDNSEAVSKAREKSAHDNSFAAAVLNLHICDPAMGSGHFLVEATMFLADQIALHPTTTRLSDQSKDEEEIAHWRRRVVECCIFGVDLNPLAVELAKLSLWLTCISSDQPLNFLDHHLRVGNSLIGARLDQLGSLPDRGKKSKRIPGQIKVSFGPDLKQAVADTISKIREIEAQPSADVSAVKQKERRWAEEILPLLERYKAVADLWTNDFFGGELDESAYVDQAQKILKRPKFKYAPDPRHFFHWELEFPEVFFNEDGSHKKVPGFDGVIGNPPYGRLLDDIEANYANFMYESSGSILDVFAMFIEHGARLTREGGDAGWIIPSGWLTAREHKPLRKFVLERLTPEAVIHLPYDVFGAAYIDCIILIAERKNPTNDDQCFVKRYGVREEALQIPSPPDEYIPIQIDQWIADPDKLMITEPGLGFWLGAWRRSTKYINMDEILIISRGITPFVEPTSEDVRKTELGFFGSIGRYYLETRKLSTVVYDPSLMEYKPPKFFSGKRLLIRRIISRQHRIHSTLATAKFVISKSCLIALQKPGPYTLEFALAIINSKLMARAFVSMSEIAKRDDFPQLDIASLNEFPIPRIRFRTPADMRMALLVKAKSLSQLAIAECDSSQVLAFINQQLMGRSAKPDVIHDLLTFLAENMISMNEDKRTAQRQFLTDLKDFHSIDVHLLKPKTLLDQFWKLEAQDLFEHFRRNHKVLGAAKVNLDDEAENKIRSRFEKAKAVILPLESQIEFTDRLIDQIVYKLYGLTEEEIAIVEGSAKN